MTVKPRKTKDELRAIIMAAVQSHPEWGKIRDVAIIRPVGQDWGAQFIMDGGPIATLDATFFVTDLQHRFDLVSG